MARMTSVGSGVEGYGQLVSCARLVPHCFSIFLAYVPPSCQIHSDLYCDARHVEMGDHTYLGLELLVLGLLLGLVLLNLLSSLTPRVLQLLKSVCTSALRSRKTSLQVVDALHLPSHDVER